MSSTVQFVTPLPVLFRIASVVRRQGCDAVAMRSAVAAPAYGGDAGAGAGVAERLPG